MRALACCWVVVAACNGDRYGAYLHITSPENMDQIEFVFGGYMPSLACDGTVIPDATPLRHTPTFDNRNRSAGDTMFRRQPSAGDVRQISGTEYTLYVDTPVNDPNTPFDDRLGHALIVVAHSAQDTLVGELDDFVVSRNEVDKYEIVLQPVSSDDLEQWGGGDERCLRYTRNLPDLGRSSAFIVPTWDRDCDGFFTQLCYTDSGDPIDDDCNPLAFCDTSIPGDPGCIVPDGCATDNGSANCTVSACQNVGGVRGKMCTTSTEFCLADTACSIDHCERPVPECIAVKLDPDVECDVPAIKIGHSSGDDQVVACPAAETGLLHAGPPDMFCTVIAATPLDPGRTLGVGFDTPTEVGSGCDLALGPVAAGAPELLPESRLLVEVTATSQASGMLVVAVKPMILNNCQSPPPISCQPTDATLEVCGF